MFNLLAAKAIFMANPDTALNVIQREPSIQK